MRSVILVADDEPAIRVALERLLGGRGHERDFLTRALERHRGNVTRAAEEIGMYRQQLQSKAAKLGIDLESLRRG